MHAWIVKMNRKGSGFEVEVMASSQTDAKKRAKEQHPDANVVSAKRK